ncbi:hypothetical protein G2W53_043172 [Senna tora]|uniref:Uncharacterized protein n=1 Tax=Senna tora TaxID=362788 RepID=A0A834SI81_9FABA|nr:hypothetical protein G2W53_043172 [Senna tora]
MTSNRECIIQMASLDEKRNIDVYKIEQRKLRNHTYPTCNDNPSNHRDKSSICDPSLSLKSSEIGEDGSEKGGGGTDGLIEGNSEELGPGFDGLMRHNLEKYDGDVAEKGTGRHMAHCEEDGEFEAIIGEQVLVQEDHSNV